MFFKFFTKRKAAKQQTQIAKQNIESKPVYETNNFDLDFDDSDLRQPVQLDAKPMTAAQMRSIKIWFSVFFKQIAAFLSAGEAFSVDNFAFFVGKWWNYPLNLVENPKTFAFLRMPAGIPYSNNNFPHKLYR